MTKMTNSPPGSVWVNNGRFHWRVRLPGTKKRKNYPLRPPGEAKALAAGRGRDLAESIAWRMWENASREALTSHANGDPTLEDVCARYLDWARTYYRRSDETQTGEAYNCELALRPLRAKYGRRSVNDMTYADIIETRDGLVAEGLTRGVVNQRVSVWKRFYAWALENRLCKAQVKSEVWAITSLKKFRSPAPEGAGQQPVRHRDVKAVLPYLPEPIRTMVQVHELCGARPTELCLLRPCDIEKKRGMWFYTPRRHKTQHHGQPRVIAFGPRAQRLLRPLFRGIPKTQNVFRPVDTQRWRKRELGQPTGGIPAKTVYTQTKYGHVVHAACDKAERDGVDFQRWTPNQLRHACATRVRRKFGADAARQVLGHSGKVSRITDRYTTAAILAETKTTLARIMGRLG